MKRTCIEGQCVNDTDLCEESNPYPKCYESLCQLDGSCSNTSFANGNECYEAVCTDDGWELKKKTEAEEWENRTNDCIAYQCHNQSGLIWWSRCNSSDDKHMLCVNDTKCVEEDDEDDKKWAIDIQINGTGDDPISTKDIAVELSNMTGLDEEDFVITIQCDDKGNLIRITVYVDDEATAKAVVTYAEDKCSRCRTARVREVIRFESLSNAHSLQDDRRIAIKLFMTIVFISSVIDAL